MIDPIGSTRLDSGSPDNGEPHIQTQRKSKLSQTERASHADYIHLTMEILEKRRRELARSVGAASSDRADEFAERVMDREIYPHVDPLTDTVEIRYFYSHYHSRRIGQYAKRDAPRRENEEKYGTFFAENEIAQAQSFDPSFRLQDKERAIALVAAIASLPADQRLVLMLHAQGLSSERIALILSEQGMKPGSGEGVRKKLARIIATLQRQLSDYM